jgi:hypothetical protein
VIDEPILLMLSVDDVLALLAAARVQALLWTDAIASGQLVAATQALVPVAISQRARYEAIQHRLHDALDRAARAMPGDEAADGSADGASS